MNPLWRPSVLLRAIRCQLQARVEAGPSAATLFGEIPGVLPVTLRASLRLFKFDPVKFVHALNPDWLPHSAATDEAAGKSQGRKASDVGWALPTNHVRYRVRDELYR